MENGKLKIKVMKSTKQQLLRSPDIQPTSEVIEEALGAAYNAYLKFVKELENHDIQLEWRYYTDGKAWLGKGIHKWVGVRGGQNETTAFWLSIWDCFFKVTIFIPEKARADAYSLPLDDEVKQMIDDSKQMGKKLKFFPLVFELSSDEKFKAIYALVEFRKRLK
ncbi:DUF3788 family protein [Youngiibacter multivorans]|uniref:DUF3788 family protein n=1 Tax=Youngiibacter multivorans TaxID=937251 RepID=A0ABS4G581_9CLOT|nr:DUF3788 family protein [Youngiibacter multivorans]MBP1919720.1 hypothetical protein [Youngiibacter multivorans]